MDNFGPFVYLRIHHLIKTTPIELNFLLELSNHHKLCKELHFLCSFFLFSSREWKISFWGKNIFLKKKIAAVVASKIECSGCQVSKKYSFLAVDWNWNEHELFFIIFLSTGQWSHLISDSVTD